ncbi:MAG: site-specific integrase [Bryobacteraceae bacterium]|nr:site-specific integrase [Bryobacteraceae bacterium]
MAVFRPTYTDPKTGEKKQQRTWWYEFVRNGERYRESAKVTNKRDAEAIEAARKTELAKGEVGIKDRPPAPTLKEFEKRFTAEIETARAEHPETVSFYKEKYRRLLEHAPLANARLDAIDEELIDAYKQTRRRQVSRYGRVVSPGSVNRELATLSRALRLAKKWKVITAVPTISRLSGERNREFVLPDELEETYLAAAPQPLQDAAVLMLDTAVRVGEAVQLRWFDVFLKPAIGARHGYIRIRKGKSKNAKRTLSLTPRVAEMLKTRKKASESEWVFPGDSPNAPILVTSLDHQHDDVREILNLSAEFVIHSLRHTMLTRLGEAGADAFTIMKIAGHSSVTVSQRYVHPSPDSLERAFERLEARNAKKREATEKVPKESPKVEILEMPRKRRKSMK